MSEQKHTPGPWKANLYLGGAYAIDRIAPNGDRLATVATVCGALETKANARLIAAAPDLLEACRNAERTIRRLCQMYNEEVDHIDEYLESSDKNIKPIRKAIAKAEGGAR